MGTTLRLHHFTDNHWYYQRQGQPMLTSLPLRLYQHVLEPLPVQGRGRPRRNESSTRRDPSAFERPVLPTIQPARQTLAEILLQTSTAMQPAL